MECPYCRGPVPDGASFCQTCGASIVTKVEDVKPTIHSTIENQEQPVNNYSNNNRKKKTSTFSTVILVLIIVGIVVGIKMFNKDKDEGSGSQNGNDINNTNTMIVTTKDSFLMYIEDVFYIDSDVYVTGKINRGTIKTGDKVQVLGLDRNKQELEVARLEQFRKVIDSATEGENIGIIFKGADIADFERGQAVTAVDSMRAYKEFEADIELYTKEKAGYQKTISNNDEADFYFYVNEFEGKIILLNGAKQINPGDKVTVKVKLDKSVVMEPGSEFTLRDGGRTFGTGTVNKGL